MNNPGLTVIGAGLAGCEAAFAAAGRGIPVTLWEQKPLRRSPAHSGDGFAELVCSNSLKAQRLGSAAGLLKAEMERMGSICMEAARACAVPAGGALAVDRDAFSQYITDKLAAHPNIMIEHKVCEAIPAQGAVVVATGPLTDGALAEDIERLCGARLAFYDAAAPIVTAESLCMEHIFSQSRYDRGGADDYLNCPLNKEQYERFQEALCGAQTALVHDFDVYEGCMPIEVLAARGKDAIRFGPMKPVGLRDPRTGRRPWAVLQLRRENKEGSLYNLVGFQTNLKFGEQQRVFGMIPALENAEFVRYGVMHRNSFLSSPGLLDLNFALRRDPRVFFAGQITGVEGDMESALSGLLAGQNAARRLWGKSPLLLPQTTMSGALSRYVSEYEGKDFQPMGANFGILPPLSERIKDKRLRYEALANRGLSDLEQALKEANFDNREMEGV